MCKIHFKYLKHSNTKYCRSNIQNTKIPNIHASVIKTQNAKMQILKILTRKQLERANLHQGSWFCNTFTTAPIPQ